MNKLKLLSVFLTFCFLGTLSAQRTVSGTITGEDGSSIIGANISEKGTTNGTLSDIDGSYSLTVAGETSIIVISYIGLVTVEEVVGGRTSIDVTMSEDSELLDEIVVSALGFKEKKDEMGSTVSRIGVAQTLRSGEPQVLNSLAGKASNVEILATNGDPGAGTNFRIRGANTILGSSAPLIIVDGVPLNNSTVYGGAGSLTGTRSGGVSNQSRINDINPNDIESISVLKGASAASLWGSRAANGVLVITTKDGKAGKPKISFSSSLSFDKIAEQMPMQTAFGKGRDGVYDERSSRSEAWGDRIADRPGGEDDVDTSGEYFEAADGTRYYPLADRNVKNNTQTFVDENFDAVYQTGKIVQNDISISGGTDRARFFFSIGHLDQEGIVKESAYQRTNLRLNNKMVFNDWISMSTKAAYTKSFGNRIQQSSNTSGLLLGLLRTPPDFDQRNHIGTYYDDDGVPTPNSHRSYRNMIGASINPGYSNPLWSIFEQKNTTDVNRFTISSEVNVTPNNWLTFTLRGGADTYTDRRVTFFPVGSADGDTRNGAYGEDLVQELELNFDAFLKARFNLNSDIGLSTTLGWNINDRDRNFNEALLQGFLVRSSKITTDLNTAAEASSIEVSRRFIRSNRGYGILSFDLYDQLFVNLSGTVEAVSSITERFFYPSADLAWQFTNLSSLKGGTGVLSFGKLRLAWGQVGIQPSAHRTQNFPEGGFAYSTYSDGLSINQFGGGFRIDNNGNDLTLRPEVKTEWEIGTDLRFFDNKLGLTLTYYSNKIEDMLLSIPTSNSSGFETLYTNAATMKNSGIEWELNYTILNTSDWNLKVFNTFSNNKNEVTDLKGVESVDIGAGQSVSSRAVEGQPLGVLWGTAAQKNEDGSYVLNENGFPIITASEGIIGDPNPDWRSGIGFEASWKNFSLSALFDHQQGGDFSFRTQFVLGRFGTTEETGIQTTLTQDVVNYDGDVFTAGTTVRGNIFDYGGGPVLRDESWYRTGPGGGFGDGKIYEFAIYDATNTRLREISLNYTIRGTGFTNTTKLESVTIGVTGRNLLVWDDLEGVDPQVNQFGVGNSRGLDYFTNPSTKSFLFNLKVNF
jgi:TonB-linked SusC/RagA family outer membrane protein